MGDNLSSCNWYFCHSQIPRIPVFWDWCATGSSPLPDVFQYLHALLVQIVWRHGLSCNQYTNDTQFYRLLNGQMVCAQIFWMGSYRLGLKQSQLKLKPLKTEPCTWVAGAQECRFNSQSSAECLWYYHQKWGVWGWSWMPLFQWRSLWLPGRLLQLEAGQTISPLSGFSGLNCSNPCNVHFQAKWL